MERRLHPAAVGAEALSGLRQIALPVLVVAVLGTRGPEAIGYAAAGLVITLVYATLVWATTRWYLEDDAIRLRRGILSESITTIPYDRIQAIDTVRGPVQRLFGVVEAHVQSAGGGRSAEIVLRAITSADAELLRATSARPTHGARPLEPEGLRFPESPLGTGPGPVQGAGAGPEVEGWRLGSGALVVAALTSGSLGVLVPVVAGATQMLDDVLGVEDAERFVPDSPHEVAIAVAVVVGVAWVLSVLGTLLAFAGFAVARDGDRLRIRRGVIERRDASVPVARVHAIRVVESPLRQPFGLAQVRIETAGYARERATAQTLLPLVRRRDAEALIARLLPELAAPGVDPEPVPARAARRYATLPAAAGALAAAGLLIAFGTPALPALALPVLGAALGLARHRAAAFARSDEHVVLRARGWLLTRTTSTADARRLQSVRASVSPFQRRGRLATIGVDVSSGRQLRVTHVDGGQVDAHVTALARIATGRGQVA
jgi:putative membrane protein